MAILLGVLPGAPLLGDDVYLKNGRSFENVVAEVGDEQVRVHMPGGVVSLPRSAVDRVEKSDSSFAEYSRRKQDLESRARGPRPPGAGDWLELARWARLNNLPQAAREAALKAAVINPREAGLAGLLRGFGYVYEESLDRWIPYDDAMRLHGMVQEGGTWVSREEHAARLLAERDQREQQAARGAAAAAAARDEAAAAMLQAQAALAQQGAVDNGYGGGMTLGGFYGGYGGYWPFGGASVFGVPGFGVARRGFGERGFHEHHRGGAGGPGNRARGTVFGVPRAQTSFRASAGTSARGMRAAGRR
ncbi:MAG TPA: hypothetical protein VOA80_24915 [Thermoanaerobaculia bacterium]|nr:hypothetical protein [Thermoanaerobaculia bacterium]